MKKTAVGSRIVGVLLVTAFLSVAWGPGYGKRNFSVSDSPCWTKPYLEATPEQLNDLENLQRSFYKENSGLRNRHIKLHYELRSLLDYTKPDARLILEKQKQLSGIQRNMDEVSIRYLLRARALFAPDQLSRLPSGCNLGFNSGQGTGRGQRRGGGGRY